MNEVVSDGSPAASFGEPRGAARGRTSKQADRVPRTSAALGAFAELRPRYLWDITIHLLRRELANRHRNSILGWVWSLVPPLLQLGATHFLFTRVMPLGIDNYPVFLLTGILAWNLFSKGVSLGASSLEVHRGLVLRPGFPTMVLPIVATLVALVDYVFALPVLLGALALTTGIHVQILALPAILAIELILTVAFAIMFAPMQIFFRDVQHLVAVALSVGFWITPVFYRARQIPESLTHLFSLNPMAQIIEAQRSVLLGGPGPSAATLGLVALASLCTLAIAVLIFSRCRHAVPDQI